MAAMYAFLQGGNNVALSAAEQTMLAEANSDMARTCVAAAATHMPNAVRDLEVLLAVLTPHGQPVHAALVGAWLQAYWSVNYDCDRSATVPRGLTLGVEAVLRLMVGHCCGQ